MPLSQAYFKQLTPTD